MVEGGLVLGGLEAFRDAPAGSDHRHQTGKRDRRRRVAAVEGQLRGPADRAADQQPMSRAGGGHQRPVVVPLPFGARASQVALPGGLGNLRRDGVGGTVPAPVVI